MGHPALEEFCRIPMLQSLQTLHFRRFQRIFKDEVQPLLDERERLIEEKHALLEENAALKRQLENKRGRKHTETVPA